MFVRGPRAGEFVQRGPDLHEIRRVTRGFNGNSGSPISSGATKTTNASNVDIGGHYYGISLEFTVGPQVGVTIDESGGNTTVAENGGTDTYTVVLDGAPTHDVTIQVTITTATRGPATVNKQGGTAGHTQTLTFTPTTWETPQTITVTGVDDNIDNPGNSRSVTIRHTVSSTDTNYNNLFGSDLTVTVSDNDAAPTMIDLSVDDSAVDEGDGAQTITVTAMVQGSTRFGVAKTVAATVAGSGRSNVVDFTAAPSTFNITIPAGAQSAVWMFTLTPTDDSVVENSEEITVSGVLSGVTVNSALITLTDDDSGTLPVLSITGGSAVNEGGGAQFTIVANPPVTSTSGITLHYTVSQSGDFVAAADLGSKTRTFRGQSATYAVSTLNDNMDEPNGSVTIELDDGTGYTVGLSSSATVTVRDDDGTSMPEITISGGSAITEGGSATFTISASPAPTSAITVNIGVSQTGDYGATGAATVSVGGATTTYTISTSDDDADEADGSVTATVQTGNGYSVGTPASATVTVRDNDGVATPEASVARSSSTVGENQGTHNVSVTLDPAPPATITVRYVLAGTADTGTDYTISGVTGRSGTVTVNSDATSVNIPIVITNDSTQEGSETIILTLLDGTGYARGTDNTHTVTITDDDGTTTPPGPSGPIIGGGGGGGGPSGPQPSEVEFEWNVTRDIEELDGGHGAPTGSWSDGTLLWLLENGVGADDAVYAYDLATGERVEEREFELDERNRAPRGIWSDGTTAWVSDSGRDRLFAYDLATGERLPDHDIELDTRNADARGIWSDGETMWVLDGRRDALFAYDLESGEALAEYGLHATNDDPQGLWSDGVVLWVSNHDPKRLFAYRLPNLPTEGGAPPEEPPELERVLDEEFDTLSRASNNSPRGIWSDGDLMYVADANDGRVYSYNMPGAINARLASLTLSAIEIGEFSANRTEYEGIAAEGVTETVVTAQAKQRGAGVVIEPADSDERASGHQVALAGTDEITVTVTSADRSRTRIYRVALSSAVADRADCLLGSVSAGFSLVVHQGGSIEDLESCARHRAVTALYALDAGAYVSYQPGAPEFVNRAFIELFAGGVPALTPLVVASAGPPSAGPSATTTAAAQSWPECLRGDVAEGFSAVVYEGGSVEELAACAGSRGVAALYVLREGDWLSYFPGAPEFVNRRFNTLFSDGLPALTPLIVSMPSEASRVADATGTDAAGTLRKTATSTSDDTATRDAASTEPATAEPPTVGVIANTDGLGVSHRNDCADEARLSRFGWAEGDTVDVLAEGAGRCAGWLWVRADGVTSWVRDEYVAGFARASRDTALQVAQVIANTDGLGVSHRNDCADEARLSRFGWAEGDTVEVLAGGAGRCSGWHWVRADGVTSWVREQYLLPPRVSERDLGRGR